MEPVQKLFMDRRKKSQILLNIARRRSKPPTHKTFPIHLELECLGRLREPMSDWIDLAELDEEIFYFVYCCFLFGFAAELFDLAYC